MECNASRRKASTKTPLQEPRPSSSIVLLSPTNQVLLLHRVQTSSSFPSAHVFPGGNLSAFHEVDIPSADAPDRHQDGRAYRLGAIRETFEESGILLARSSKDKNATLLDVSKDVRENGRKEVHGNKIRFPDWLAGLDGVTDVENLYPFTRWVTPTNQPKRFTTQMYLYMLPLSTSPQRQAVQGTPEQEALVHTPTADGGIEHTAATFGDASVWLDKQRSGEIVLFPPQQYLLSLLSQFLTSPATTSDASADYEAQRKALIAFLRRTPTVSSAKAAEHPTSSIPWAEKVISPHTLFIRKSDKRVVLGLDRPGPELKGSGRGGDWERVVLVRFEKEGPREVEVRSREEVLKEEREEEQRAKEEHVEAKL